MTDPKASSPFGLKQPTHPRVRAEAGHVVVRLELASLRDQTDVIDIEIVLHPQIAEQIAWALLENAKKLA